MTIRRSITQSNFDSIFEPAQPGQPAKLSIDLKVTLVPLDPSVAWSPPQVTPVPPAQLPPAHLAASMALVKRGPVKDYNNRVVNCRSWLVTEWNEFKSRFKKSVEHGWNGQIILLPTESSDPNDRLSDADYLELVSSPNVQAHAEGVIGIEIMPITKIGHVLIEVAHLDTPGDRFRVWMNRITDESVQFKFHRDDKWPAWKTGQITVAHEIGHWLRDLNSDHFEHIDAAYASTLPRAQRGKAQYGRTLGRKEALMGDGSLVTDHEAQPWLGRIRRHTTMKFGWSMVHAIEFQKMKTAIPERQKQLAGRP
jgi:hypothetical protein